jgi:hypothetical protein
VQIGELRESQKPLRCAYCHAAVGAAPVVCRGCGTRLHPECVGSLGQCPTLGCARVLDLGEDRARFPWVRAVIGSLLLGAAVARVVFTHHHCGDPGCMRSEVAASIHATMLGLPGTLLVLPVLRGRFTDNSARLGIAVIGALTFFLGLPLVCTALDPFQRIERFHVGWFSYSMSGWSLGDPDFDTSYPSTHLLLLLVVGLRALAWIASHGRDRLRAVGVGRSLKPSEPVGALPPLTPDQARALESLRFDPNARRSYELLSGGFVWTDETCDGVWHAPDAGDEQWYVLRYLWGYRASLIRGAPDERLRSTWDAMVANYPDWPGLRPERRSTALAAELEAQARVALDDLERNGLGI